MSRSLVGRLIADNDPRSRGRRGRIIEEDGAFVWVQWGPRTTRVAKARLEKAGRSGYRFVEDGQ